MDEPRSRPEPGVTREVVRGLGEVVRTSPDVQQVVGGLLLLVLMVIFVPAGLLYLLVAGLLYYVIFGVLLPVGGGQIMGFIGVAYWIGALIGLFVFFRAIYRWLARRSRAVQGATEVAFGGRRPGDDEASAFAVHAAPDRTAPDRTAPPEERTPSLAELDARLAPPEPPAADRR